MNNTDKTYGIFNSDINKKLLKKLETKENRVIKFPLILRSKVENRMEHQTILSNLQRFDWVILTDVFAADLFIELLESTDIDLYELDNVRVCAFGEAVSDRLRFVQIHADIIANRINDDSIFKQLADYLVDLDEFSNLEVLFVQGNEKEFGLKVKLNEVNSNVTEFVVYENQPAENITKLRLLTLNGAIDEFIFSSPDEVFDLVKVYLGESLSLAMNELEVRANNETTIQTLREFGFTPKLYK